MSYDSGSKIVTDNLIFSFNANSERSYAGPPIQNMANVIVASGSFSDTNIAYTAGTETVTVPTLGTMTVPFMDGYNANSGSYCCLQQFYFVTGNGFVACSGSTQYTYSIVYRTTSGYTHPNFMYRYEYTSGGSYVTEAGVHDDTKRVHLGDGWYWAWNTFTTNASTARLYLRCFYYQYNISERFSVARVMVTPGDYTGLPPRLWPALGTTRSNTQAIVDLSKNNTITANSLTYAANGSFSFNGSSNFISWGSNSMSSFPGITLDAWVSMTASGTNWTRIFDFGAGQNVDNILLCQYSTTNQLAFYIIQGSTQYSLLTDSVITDGANTHFAATADGTNWTVYKNGVSVATTARSILPLNVTRNSNYIGRSNWPDPYLNGRVFDAKIYNRALTAAEIRQNFNAHRGVYGV